MIVRGRCITRGGGLALVVGFASLCTLPAVAAGEGSMPGLRGGEYSVRAVCGAPATRQARCMALQLVPRGTATTPSAQAQPSATAESQTVAPARSAAAGEFGLRPQDLHSAYELPSSAPDGQTIALVDAYNDLGAEADLGTYSKEFGLPACTSATGGCFEQVNQNGETGNPPFPTSTSELESALNGLRRKKAEEAIGWGLEISLDIETAHAVCNNCHIVLVEASSPSFANLETAENTAARLGATEISNSWGGSECVFAGDCASSSAFNHPGIVITAAAGDEGYLNWLEGSPSYANFPATSPQVVAVGGTHLSVARHGEWAGESVWNDGGESDGVTEGVGATGGGCSAEFTAPLWQQAVADWSKVGCGDKRAVADVSADADPYSGVAVYDSSEECPYLQGYTVLTSHWCQLGGTSLATPLIGATFALAGGANGAEYPARTLYENVAGATGSLHDVTEGSNGECTKPFEEETGVSECTATEEAKASCASRAICLARAGYDGPTGLGTPEGISAFEPPRAPTVASEAASSVTKTAARLAASVNPNGREVSECKFEYGTSPAYGSSVPCGASPGSGTSPVAVSASINGLTPGTPYHFRIVASDIAGAADGEDETFQTLAPGPPPAIEGEAAAHVSDSDATLEAQIDPEGRETKYEVVLEDPCAPPAECITDVVVATASLAAGTTAEPIEVDLASSGATLNIEPNTTYHYWVLASNAAGATESPHETFTTLSGPPAVVTHQASSIRESSATVSASVNPEGANTTACVFEYGTTTAYGASAPCEALPGAGDTPVSVSAQLTDLTAATTYHFRISATNANSTSTGEDGTFTTLAEDKTDTTQLPTTLGQQGPGKETPPPVQGSESSPEQAVAAVREQSAPPPDAGLASRSLTANRSGVIYVRVSCPATETSCAGRVTLRTLGAVVSTGSSHPSARAKAVAVTLAAGSFTVKGGHVTTVALHLSRNALALVAPAHALRARATILARNPAGATHTAQVLVTIRAS
jgi:hypothetical protein